MYHDPQQESRKLEYWEVPVVETHTIEECTVGGKPCRWHRVPDLTPSETLGVGITAIFAAWACLLIVMVPIVWIYLELTKKKGPRG